MEINFEIYFSESVFENHLLDFFLFVNPIYRTLLKFKALYSAHF